MQRFIRIVSITLSLIIGTLFLIELNFGTWIFGLDYDV